METTKKEATEKQEECRKRVAIIRILSKKKKEKAFNLLMDLAQLKNLLF